MMEPRFPIRCEYSDEQMSRGTGWCYGLGSNEKGPYALVATDEGYVKCINLSKIGTSVRLSTDKDPIYPTC